MLHTETKPSKTASTPCVQSSCCTTCARSRDAATARRTVAEHRIRTAADKAEPRCGDKRHRTKRRRRPGHKTPQARDPKTQTQGDRGKRGKAGPKRPRGPCPRKAGHAPKEAERPTPDEGQKRPRAQTPKGEKQAPTKSTPHHTTRHTKARGGGGGLPGWVRAEWVAEPGDKMN